jgi:hypothetical protein
MRESRGLGQQKWTPENLYRTINVHNYVMTFGQIYDYQPRRPQDLNIHFLLFAKQTYFRPHGANTSHVLAQNFQTLISESALCESIVALDHPADILSKLAAAEPRVLPPSMAILAGVAVRLPGRRIT